MSASDYLLPPAALSGLVNVMFCFNQALRGHIETFQEGGDKQEFEDSIGRFRCDLVGFMQNFDAMHESAETFEEFQKVEELGKLFAEGQILITTASELLKKS